MVKLVPQYMVLILYRRGERMLENININGAQVSAELHGFMYQGVYGYSGIYNFDNNCEAVIQSNNEIQLKSGFSLLTYSGSTYCTETYLYRFLSCISLFCL